MEEDLLKLRRSITQAWETFSEAADWRKDIEESYGKLLACREDLVGCLKHEKNEENRKIIERIISDIDNFYHTDIFPDWKSYDKERHFLDGMIQSLDNIIEKLNI